MALLDRITQNPFGYNTALSNGSQNGVGGSFGDQYKAQGAAYGRALRLLNRQARKGNINASLQAIKTRKDAMGDGFSPGGIGNVAERNADIEGRAQITNLGSQSATNAINSNLQRTAGQPTISGPPAPALGSVSGPGTGSQFDQLTKGQAGNTGFEFSGSPGPAIGSSELSYETELGQMGQAALNRSAQAGNGFSNLALRQGLDRAIGRSSKPAELNDLRQLSETMGVKPEAFNSRVKWWNRKNGLTPAVTLSKAPEPTTPDNQEERDRLNREGRGANMIYVENYDRNPFRRDLTAR